MMASEVLIPADMAVSSKFASFNLVDVSYKVVGKTEIPATILVPKSAKPGRHPVMVRWHGGCLITGHRMYPEWFGSWILELALSKDAIVISPDYRLMPDADGLDILEDVRDFYSWLTTPDTITTHLPHGIKPDVNHLLVTGESAGGWLALQSALLPASRRHVSAVISLYPMIDMRDSYYTGDYEKHIFTPVAPQLPRSIFEDYMQNLRKDSVVTSATPPDRVPLVISALQQGRFSELLGDDSSIYPLEILESVTDLPPIWVLHGMGDTVIPIEGTYKFEKKLREKLPDTKVHFSYELGDHGFDNASDANLDTSWVRKGVAFIEHSWAKC